MKKPKIVRRVWNILRIDRMKYLFSLEATDEAARELRENLESPKKGLQHLLNRLSPLERGVVNVF